MMADQQITLACVCGLLYSDPGWCDCYIPDEAWAVIAPRSNGGGVLCITCMARRLRSAGLDRVPLMVTSGPFLMSPWVDEIERLQALAQIMEVVHHG